MVTAQENNRLLSEKEALAAIFNGVEWRRTTGGNG